MINSYSWNDDGQRNNIFDDVEENTEIDNSDIAEEEKPFDADKIRIEQQMLSVKYVYELYQQGLLDTNPDFQRRIVWTENKRKSLLIESLMFRIPIPAFYFYENDNGVFQVIDGQQRLCTIFDFIEDKYRLVGLEYAGEKCNKKKFSELEVKYQQRIFRTQLAVNILDIRSPYQVVYDIFRRINTGGRPLNPQEMRNAICSSRTRLFLKEGAENPEYIKATRNKIEDFRMDSQELFLRFVSFYRLYDFNKLRLNDYYFSKVSDLMDEEIRKLDDLDDNCLRRILFDFEESMKKCKEAFGEYAFVRVFIDNGKISRNKDLINKALFTAFSVILANPEYRKYDFSSFSERILHILATKLEEDAEFSKSITTATGDRRNVICYFSKAQEVITECVKLL